MGQKMRSACHPGKNVPPRHKSKTGVSLQKRGVRFGTCTFFFLGPSRSFIFKGFNLASFTPHLKYALSLLTVLCHKPDSGLKKVVVGTDIGRVSQIR